jgi:hypothetical protein
MKRWPLFTIAALAAALVTTRAVNPDLLHLDGVSLVLFGAGSVALLFCYLPMKRVKVGDVEIEMELSRLDRDVKAAQEHASREDRVIPAAVPRRVAVVLEDAGRNPGGAVLALCAMLEEAVRDRLGPEAGGILSLEQGISYGVSRGVFSPPVLSAFRTFWELKGRISRQNHFHVDEAVLLTLIASATDLLKLIASTPAAAPLTRDDLPPTRSDRGVALADRPTIRT